MTRLLHRPKRDEDVLLAACASSRPAPAAPAAHLSRRRDRDRPVGFADVAALPDPEWSRSGHNISRYSVDGLVPGGQAAIVPLPLHGPAEDPRVSPLPIEEQIDRAQHVMRSRDAAFEAVMTERGEASAERYASVAAATWMDEAIGRLIAEKARFVLDAVADRPELLTPPTHPGPRLWLRRIGALLDEPLPGSDWAANLRAVLPTSVAQPKGVEL